MFSSKIPKLGVTIILSLVILAILAPWITPFEYAAQNIANKQAEPMTGFINTTDQLDTCHWANTSLEWGCTIYLLGADGLGRDLLSRLIYGIRTSLLVGFITAAVSLVIGTSYGLISGYLQTSSNWLANRAEDVMTGFTDLVGSFPPIIIIIFLILFFHYLEIMMEYGRLGSTGQNIIDMNMRTNGLLFVIIAISSSSWIHTARLVKRISVRAYKKALVIDSKLSIGQAFNPVKNTVFMFEMMSIPTYILTGAAFGFLRLGVLPPYPSLGYMVGQSFVSIRNAPHIFWAPALTLTLTIIGFNLITADMRRGIKAFEVK
jgi:ABC-type dipeptide/oligopeptide/nickel transport system permease subunit